MRESSYYADSPGQAKTMIATDIVQSSTTCKAISPQQLTQHPYRKEVLVGRAHG